jgi:hypothetical protein
MLVIVVFISHVFSMGVVMEAFAMLSRKLIGELAAERRKPSYYSNWILLIMFCLISLEVITIRLRKQPYLFYFSNLQMMKLNIYIVYIQIAL